MTLYKEGSNDVTCFDRSEVEHIPKKKKKKNRKMIDKKNITLNISRIQAYGALMFRYFCIGFIDFKNKW